jgi:hypothetical protein
MKETPFYGTIKVKNTEIAKKRTKYFKELSEQFTCTVEEIQRKLHNLRNQVST